MELDSTQPYGFDVEKTLPCEYWLREQLHRFDHALLQALLRATVAALYGRDAEARAKSIKLPTPLL